MRSNLMYMMHGKHEGGGDSLQYEWMSALIFAEEVIRKGTGFDKKGVVNWWLNSVFNRYLQKLPWLPIKVSLRRIVFPAMRRVNLRGTGISW